MNTYTFEMFQSTGRYVDDLSKALPDLYEDRVPGRVYAGDLVIEDSLGAANGVWMLNIENSSRCSDDLAALERELFEYGHDDILPPIVYGIRCERDGSGKLPPAVAWYKVRGKEQRFATLAEARRMADSLRHHARPCSHYEARAFALGLDQEPSLAGPEAAEALTQWARAYQSLGQSVCEARAFAASEDARVQAYILPIFHTFGFVYADGKPIAHYDDIYLSSQEEEAREFWQRCQDAHQAHGFVGEPLVWPNLQARRMLSKAEDALINAFCEFLALPRPWGRKREELLTALLNACLSALPVSEE